MSSNSQQSAESADSKELPRFTDWPCWNPNIPSSVTGVGERIRNPIDEPDTNNATMLPNRANYDRGKSYETSWEELDKYNTGLSNRKWTSSSYTTYLLNRHHINALTSQLDLTDNQRKVIYNRFMQLEWEEWGVSANLLAFCVCAVIVHDDNTNRNYHYNQSEENKDSIFVQIAESLNLRQKSIRKVYSKYRRHLANKSSSNSDCLEHEKRRWTRNDRGDKTAELQLESQT